jgi:hypothetical protein
MVEQASSAAAALQKEAQMLASRSSRRSATSMPQVAAATNTPGLKDARLAKCQPFTVPR